jgi:peroxiredoxin family protein/TusA-related sulfurtransferase/rhodanese-related sulfurtransferase
MAADNVLKGYIQPIFPDELGEDYLVDVRKENEFNFKTIPGAINISHSKLRENSNNIPTDKRVVLFCNRGFQSYVASRILLQKGHKNVFSLVGGMAFYKEFIKDKLQQTPPKEINSEVQLQKAAITIDACSMQCPGPILKISEKIKEIQEGETIEIKTIDSGFMSDIDAWCNTTGNTLLKLSKENKVINATIKKGQPKNTCAVPQTEQNGQTIVVFSNDLDKVLAAFIIANGAVASGKPVTMFFTFWGLNVIKKCQSEKVKKCFIEKMFGFMLPKCANKLTLSKMNMGGMGTKMMKGIMKNKNILSINELIQSAKDSGVKFIACSMSMDVMGIKEEELIDGVEIGGVAKYISESKNANSNLFI